MLATPILNGFMAFIRCVIIIWQGSATRLPPPSVTDFFFIFLFSISNDERPLSPPSGRARSSGHPCSNDQASAATQWFQNYLSLFFLPLIFPSSSQTAAEQKREEEKGLAGRRTHLAILLFPSQLSSDEFVFLFFFSFLFFGKTLDGRCVRPAPKGGSDFRRLMEWRTAGEAAGSGGVEMMMMMMVARRRQNENFWMIKKKMMTHRQFENKSWETCFFCFGARLIMIFKLWTLLNHPIYFLLSLSFSFVFQ